MPHTIILPCAGHDSSNGDRPHWLLTTPDGHLAITRAIESIPRSDVCRIVIGILAGTEEKFRATTAVLRSFEMTDLPKPEFVILDAPTAGPAQTVYEIISRLEVHGPVALKDADSIFDVNGPLPLTSFVTVTDLRENLGITNVGEKSFVRCNEQGLIDDIVEKEVCSNLISVGLYGFNDIEVFRKNFERIDCSQRSSAIFVSHVVAAAIDRGELVSPFKVSGFVEVDSKESWRSYCQSRMTIVLDIDGVVFENHSRFFAPFWEEQDKPIEANVTHLRALQQAGAQLIFMTARPDKYRQKTLDALRAQGLEAHALVTGCNHAKRYLVNDFAPSNPYPTAEAFNLARNAPDLAKLMR